MVQVELVTTVMVSLNTGLVAPGHGDPAAGRYWAVIGCVPAVLNEVVTVAVPDPPLGATTTGCVPLMATPLSKNCTVPAG